MYCELAHVGRRLGLAATLCVAVVGGTLLPSFGARLRADESLASRRERLERLPPSEGAELLERKRRFDELTPEQQEQLRQLHEQVSQDPLADRLRQVLASYTDWLKTLPSGQRAELLSLSADQRIDKIKDLLDEQRKQQYRRFVEQPPPENDVKAIGQWLGEFIERNRERILAELSPERREKIEKIEDAKLRSRTMYFMHMRERSGRAPIIPSEEDVLELKAKLSPETWKILEQMPPPKRFWQLQQWIAGAMFNKGASGVTDEELSRFYKEDLDAKEREWLDSLPREAARRELRRYHFHHQWKKSDDASRPQFPNRQFPVPFGEGSRGSRGPRDDGRHGPDDAPQTEPKLK